MPVYLFLQYFYSIPMLWFPFKLQTSNLLVMSTACSTDWKDYISLQIYTNTVIITSMALKIQNVPVPIIIITFMALKVNKTLVPISGHLHFLHRAPIAALVLKVQCHSVLRCHAVQVLHQQAVGDWYF